MKEGSKNKSIWRLSMRGLEIKKSSPVLSISILHCTHKKSLMMQDFDDVRP